MVKEKTVDVIFHYGDGKLGFEPVTRNAEEWCRDELRSWAEPNRYERDADGIYWFRLENYTISIILLLQFAGLYMSDVHIEREA
ncbi:MAG: hypothetical protein DRP09_17305 [Candidatus Thorarchaeota archaeon]|nr:MAG: hypothetical protein DRP09_17305 [Candidatus Thorarchaeota archaeon]